MLGTQSRVRGFSTMSRRPHRGKAQLAPSQTETSREILRPTEGLQDDRFKEFRSGNDQIMNTVLLEIELERLTKQ